MKLASKEIKKIGIFRALQLGDMLCTIPAIRALRSAYPEAEITLIGLPWAKALVERFSNYFDSFIHFPGFPGLPEQPFDPKIFPGFLSEIQNRQFDLVLQMQGNGSVVNPMVELFAATHTAGFYKPDHYYPHNELFLKYPNFGHEINRHLLLMQHLGIASQGTQLEFPLIEQDFEDLALAGLGLEPGKYVCIHPGSRGISRRWNPAYFAKLADLSVDNNLKAVITGTKDELDIVSEVARHMRHQPVIAAGKTSLGAVAVLIKNSRALISNCTGVSHIASALKVPSIVISMDGEPERWAPLNRELHLVTDWTKHPDFTQVLEHTHRLISTYPLSIPE